MTRLAAVALVLIGLIAAGSQPVAIRGTFVRAESLNATALRSLPGVTIRAVEHDGSVSHYTGVALAVLLHRDGAPVGEAVRGAAARTYVAVEGTDRYIAIYTLGELDTSAVPCMPILAYERDGAALSPKIGPFRVVAPCDHTWARWVRNVSSLTIVTLPDLRHTR